MISEFFFNSRNERKVKCQMKKRFWFEFTNLLILTMKNDYLLCTNEKLGSSRGYPLVTCTVILLKFAGRKSLSIRKENI